MYFLVCCSKVSDKLEDEYFRRLDDWVRRGGPVQEIQSTVVETCGKLVMLNASTAEKVKLMTTEREEFDFRVDVCTKMTVNRIHPQPEFENPKIVSSICDESNVLLYKKLCKRSGLR